MTNPYCIKVLHFKIQPRKFLFSALDEILKTVFHLSIGEKNIEKNKKNILPYLGFEIEISVINLEIIRFWSNILMDL